MHVESILMVVFIILVFSFVCICGVVYCVEAADYNQLKNPRKFLFPKCERETIEGIKLAKMEKPYLEPVF